MSGHSSTLALSVILALFATGCVGQEPNNCGEIEPCLTYFEGSCDSKGERTICVKFSNVGDCLTAFPAADTTVTPPIPDQKWCKGNTFTTDTVKPNVDFCRPEIPGGDNFTLGIQSAFSTDNTGSRDITVSNFPNGKVECFGYTSVCTANANNDFRLIFKTTPCAATTTTTTPSPESTCTCSAFVNSGSCSKSCDGGFQQQIRACSGCGSTTLTSRFQPCNTSPCPAATTAATAAVDGMWGLWGPFGTCTVTCGGGTRTRSRICNNPAPSGGGQGCTAPATQQEICNPNNCDNNNNNGNKRQCKKRCRRQNNKGPARRRCIRAC